MYCHHHHHHHRYLSMCECTICWPSIVTMDTLQGTALQWYLWYCGMRRMMILIISTVNIKDHSNPGLFIGYLQSGTIRRSRQMHYHRNHLSPPLENQPNISRTVLAKCFWEMFNVSSFLPKTIPFISVHIQIGIHISSWLGRGKLSDNHRKFIHIWVHCFTTGRILKSNILKNRRRTISLLTFSLLLYTHCWGNPDNY